MENLESKHIIKAIQEIERTGRTDGPSFKFELLHEGNSYPPLLVIAIANRLAGGEELPPNSSKGGWDSEEFKLLKKLGFRVFEKVKKNEQEFISSALSKFVSSDDVARFFELLNLLLTELNLFTDDERLAITSRDTHEQQVSVNINSRLVLSLQRLSGENSLSFMVPNGIADKYSKLRIGNKFVFKGGDDMESVNIPTSKVKDIPTDFIDEWLAACKNYLPSQQKSQYRKFHNQGLYRLAFDSSLSKTLLQQENPTTMNYQETIQLYPIAKQFHDYMTQFHKTPGTPKEYVTWLNKVGIWFKENDIVSKPFDIWKDTTQIDAIERILNSSSKAKWKKLNSDNNNWFSAPWNRWVKFNKDVIGLNNPSVINFENDYNFDCRAFHKALISAPLSIQEPLSNRFVASLLAKRFLILTGLSGSGKTKLAQAFVRWISNDENQYIILPVAADWTNREPLFGYPNALDSKKYELPESGVLQLILRADMAKDVPHFLILDEMNLSHVERYFADFLSGLESEGAIPLHDSEEIDEKKVPKKIELPKNLFVIGTVNIDETTYMFSPKVLDRANVIEFRVSEKEIAEFLKNPVKPKLELLDRMGAGMGASFVSLATKDKLTFKEKDELNKELLEFFGQLKLSGSEFGYRTANEMHRLAGALQALNSTIQVNDVVDTCIMQKLLPKVHGSRKKMVDILKEMSRFCVKDGTNIQALLDEKKYEVPADIKYPMSLEKLHRMYQGAIENGFTSFAEA